MPPLRGWSGVLPPFVRLTISVGAHELNRGALCPLSWSAPCPFGAVGKVGLAGSRPPREMSPLRDSTFIVAAYPALTRWANEFRPFGAGAIAEFRAGFDVGGHRKLGCPEGTAGLRIASSRMEGDRLSGHGVVRNAAASIDATGAEPLESNQSKWASQVGPARGPAVS